MIKKTTRELLQFALKRFGYQSKPITFGDYVITYDFSVPTIKKQGKGVGVAVEGQIYINDLLERFLFGRAVEKNFRAIVAFIDDYILKTFQEKMTVKGENTALKDKISELEEKLAQSVVNNIDLFPNSKTDD